MSPPVPLIVSVIAVVDMAYADRFADVCALTTQNGALVFVAVKLTVQETGDPVPVVISPAVSVDPLRTLGLVPHELIVGAVPEV